jgi:hypothetical protein
MDDGTGMETTAEAVRATAGARHEDIGALRPSHPALARAHDAVTGRAEHGEITSYDRMHHRHNRS